MKIETDNYSKNIENNPEIFKLLHSNDEEDVIKGGSKLQKEFGNSQPMFVREIILDLLEDPREKIKEIALKYVDELEKLFDTPNQ